MNHAVLKLDLLTYHSPKGNYMRLSEYIWKKKKKTNPTKKTKQKKAKPQKTLGFLLLMIFFTSLKSEHVIIFFSWNRSMIFGFLYKLRADKLILEIVVEPQVWIDLGLFDFSLICTPVWGFCMAALYLTVLSPLSLFAWAKRRGRNGDWKPLPCLPYWRPSPALYLQPMRHPDRQDMVPISVTTVWVHERLMSMAQVEDILNCLSGNMYYSGNRTDFTEGSTMIKY